MTGIFFPVFLGVVFIMGCMPLKYYGLSRGREEECLHDNGVAKGLGLVERGWVCACSRSVCACVRVSVVERVGAG